MIARTEPLKQLIRFRDDRLIKVITGIRKCGKAALVEQYQEYLLAQGVQPQQIITIPFEEESSAHLTTNKKLFDYIQQKLCPDQMNYIFLLDMQKLSVFQKAIDGLYFKKNCDVYLTASHTNLFDTLPPERRAQIHMLPLSLSEYVSMQEIDYEAYAQTCTLPAALHLPDASIQSEYLRAFFDSVLLRGMLVLRKFPDPDLLMHMVRLLYTSIGSQCSINKIAGSLTSTGRKISVHTAENYLDTLTQSLLFYKISRFDIKSKQQLKTGDKYYAADLRLVQAALGTHQPSAAQILENTVFLELLRRGYTVSIGKVRNMEVHFVATNSDGTEYFQVVPSVQDPAVLKKGLAPLAAVGDHNPKTLLTLDSEPVISHNGIKQIYAPDWLMR